MNYQNDYEWGVKVIMTMHELINMIENNEPISWTDNDGVEHEVEIDAVDEKENAVISFVGGSSIRSVSIDELR